MYCKRCGKDKPESEFYHLHYSKSGRSYYCKECTDEANLACRQEIKKLDNKATGYAVGGYRIFILNHPKPKEYRYIIQEVGQEIYQTNDRHAFLDKLTDIIKDYPL